MGEGDQAVSWIGPVVAGVVVLALAVIVFRQVRKRGVAEGQLEVHAEKGDRNDKAAALQIQQ